MAMRALLAYLAIATTFIASPVEAIDVCSGPNRAERKLTCLYDGDTGWENGVKWRLKDVDTPEYNGACGFERETAKDAFYRMRELMAAGYKVEWLHEKAHDGERELVAIRLRDGRNAGIVLVEEDLAVAWPHRAGAWCKP
ncbi:MAG: hypothetical protein Rhirs2KO_12560 [Rhizobiaceae bacterium]